MIKDKDLIMTGKHPLPPGSAMWYRRSFLDGYRRRGQSCFAIIQTTYREVASTLAMDLPILIWPSCRRCRQEDEVALEGADVLTRTTKCLSVDAL